jgi:curved DNA-binding protein CbpA
MESQTSKNYYRLLEVSPSAPASEIHKAYWRQASRFHPDKGGNHEAMLQVVEAWKILSDPVKRSRYDQLLKYQHEGWQSRKFNNDVLNARKRAKEHSSRTWEEFEAVYQKAFYTFNQDFYGEDIQKNVAGPYSPLMGSSAAKQNVTLSDATSTGNRASKNGRMIFSNLTPPLLIFFVLFALILLYRTVTDTDRFVPIESKNGSVILIMDSTNGSIYSVDRQVNTSLRKEGG